MNHRTGLAIVLVSCVQVSAQQPATVSEITSRTTGTFVFNDPGSHHPITVWFCRPSSITADTRIVFVMHGSESKTASQACDIAAPEVEGLNAIVLAPEFSEKYYPQDAYTFGNMLDSRGTLVAKSEWALMSVERLFDVVRHALALPRPEYRHRRVLRRRSIRAPSGAVRAGSPFSESGRGERRSIRVSIVGAPISVWP